MVCNVGGESTSRLIMFVREILEEEGMSYDLAVDRITYRSAQELRRMRGELRLPIKLGRKIELPVTLPWDGDKLTLEETLQEARDIVGRLEEFDNERDELIADLLNLRKAAAAEVKRARKLGMLITLGGVELEPLHTCFGQLPGMIMTVTLLGHDLQEHAESYNIDGGTDLANWFGDESSEQADRADLKRHLELQGADGLIDAVCLNALRQNNVDPFAEMDRNMDFGIVDALKTPGGTIRTGWRDGVFGAMMAIGDSADWGPEGVRFEAAKKGRPVSLEGRLVTDFVPHPYIPSDLRFLCGKTDWEYTPVPVEHRYVYFNRSERRFWAD